MGTASGIIKALNSGVKHIATKRFTFRYPEQKLKFVGDGYQYDPDSGVGIAIASAISSQAIEQRLHPVHLSWKSMWRPLYPAMPTPASGSYW